MEQILNVIPLLLAPLPLIALGVAVIFREKLSTLNLVDRIFLYSWLLLFTWGVGGLALAILIHKTSSLPRGDFAVLATILIMVAAVFWLAYRLFRASLGGMNKQDD